jgi:hypothetical protein
MLSVSVESSTATALAPLKRKFVHIDKSTPSPCAIALEVIPAAAPSEVVERLLEQVDEECQFNARQMESHAYRMSALLADTPAPKRRRQKPRFFCAQLALEMSTRLGPTSHSAKLLEFVQPFQSQTADFFFSANQEKLIHAVCCPGLPVYNRGLCRKHYRKFSKLRKLAVEECQRDY